MYKLLLVSDRQEVLRAFDQVTNWEMIGFKPPHIRHDFEGAKDSLSKHSCDGIAIAVSPEEEEKIMAYLWEYYPLISIFQAGTTPEEVVGYLNELRTLLNRLHADFSEDEFNKLEMLQLYRHEFLRQVVLGNVALPELYRYMRLLRSRMDTERPCVVLELTQTSVADDRLEGRWDYGPGRMELAMRRSFGGDFAGFHVLPIVNNEGSVLVLAGPLKGVADQVPEKEICRVISNHVQEGMDHLREYKGLELQMKTKRVVPALTSFCKVPETV